MSRFRFNHSRGSRNFLIGGVAIIVLAFGAAQPLTAQYFGKNKVQWTSLNWHATVTEHFIVNHDEQMHAAAQRTTQLLERCYARFSSILDTKFKKPIPVFIWQTHDLFQENWIVGDLISEGTGGITETLGGFRRMILPLDVTTEETEHVLCHELVHEFQAEIFLESVERGSSPRQIGNELSRALWFVEGMAEYLSKGSVDPRTHTVMRDGLEVGYLRSIEKMSKTPDYLSAYRFGEALLWYIGNRYGDAGIGALLKRSTEVGVFRSFAWANIDPDSLSAEWQAFVDSTYRPQIEAFIHPNEATGVRRGTHHEFADPHKGQIPVTFNGPALSPNGKHIVYISDKSSTLSGTDNFWLASTDSADAIKKIVETGRSAGTEAARQLTSVGAFSFDGTRFVYAVQSKGRRAVRIYSFAESKDEAFSIEDEVLRESLFGIENPRFSPDGTQIVFTGVKEGQRDLYVATIDSARGLLTEIDQLTNDPHSDIHPSWSPDGNCIAFSSDRGAETDFSRMIYSTMRIALYCFQNRAVDVLPDQEEKGKYINPVWSPDGKWLAAISDRTGIANIFLWSFDEHRWYQLTDIQNAVMGVVDLTPALSWAAKENRIAFTYYEKLGYNIYVMDNPAANAWPYDASTARRPSYPAPAREITTVPVMGMVPLEKACGEIADSTKQAFSLERLCQQRLVLGPKRRKELPDSVLDVIGQKPLSPDSLPTVARVTKDWTTGFPDTLAFNHRTYDGSMRLLGICPPSIGIQIGGGSTGLGGEGCAAFSDELGYRNLFVYLNPSTGFSGQFLNDSRLSVGYTLLGRRIPFGFSLTQTPFYAGVGAGYVIDPEKQTIQYKYAAVRYLYRSACGDVEYPQSLFERFEFSLCPGMMRRDLVDATFDPLDGNWQRNVKNLTSHTFIAARTAWVYDNALPDLFNYVDGKRWRIGLDRYVGDLGITGVSADIRNYHPVAGRTSLATWFLLGATVGKSSNEFRRFWGKYPFHGYGWNSFTERECLFSDSLSYTRSSTGCLMRDEMIGSSILYGNIALRFPILDFFRGGWEGPPLGGELFCEAGTPFNGFTELSLFSAGNAENQRVRSLKSACGAKIRTGLAGMVLEFGPLYVFDREKKFRLKFDMRIPY